MVDKHSSDHDIEARVLLAALKQSLEQDDMAGAMLVHKALSVLLQDRQAFSSMPPLASGSQPSIFFMPSNEDGKALVTESGTAGRHLPEQVPTGNLYELLDVNPQSAFESIHIQFLRQVRQLLSGNKQIASWKLREHLRCLCVAHDILKDPLTRGDYDFRLLGLRGESGKQAVATPEESTGQGNRRPGLKIGELLQCSEILEPGELEIAVDMHKAMREMPFGQFLVKQEFLTQSELDSALLGQRLLAAGKITVAQFQIAMHLVRADGISISQTLTARNWATQEDVEAAKQDDSIAGKQFDSLLFSAGKVTEISLPAGRPAHSADKSISASKAIPSWAYQLDWDDKASGDAGGQQSTNLDDDVQ